MKVTTAGPASQEIRTRAYELGLTGQPLTPADVAPFGVPDVSAAVGVDTGTIAAVYDAGLKR